MQTNTILWKRNLGFVCICDKGYIRVLEQRKSWTLFAEFLNDLQERFYCLSQRKIS